jgi:hypothetical protein
MDHQRDQGERGCCQTAADWVDAGPIDRGRAETAGAKEGPGVLMGVRVAMGSQGKFTTGLFNSFNPVSAGKTERARRTRRQFNDAVMVTHAFKRGAS